MLRFVAFLAPVAAFFALTGVRRAGFAAAPFASETSAAGVSVSLAVVLVFRGTVVLNLYIGLPLSGGSASGFLIIFRFRCISHDFGQPAEEEVAEEKE